jgi:hypothetical protein
VRAYRWRGQGSLHGADVRVDAQVHRAAILTPHREGDVVGSGDLGQRLCAVPVWLIPCRCKRGEAGAVREGMALLRACFGLCMAAAYG